MSSPSGPRSIFRQPGSHDETRSCGSQPAYKSLTTRRAPAGPAAPLTDTMPASAAGIRWLTLDKPASIRVRCIPALSHAFRLEAQFAAVAWRGLGCERVIAEKPVERRARSGSTVARRRPHARLRQSRVRGRVRQTRVLARTQLADGRRSIESCSPKKTHDHGAREAAARALGRPQRTLRRLPLSIRIGACCSLAQSRGSSGRGRRPRDDRSG